MKKFNEIMKKANDVVQNGRHAIAKRSPEICLVCGIGGVVIGTVMLCTATWKAPKIVDETKTKLDDIQKAADDSGEEVDKKEVRKTYVQTGMAFAKLYGPGITVEMISIGLILVSHKQMKERNLALGAAYAALDKTSKEYRKRVIDRYGEEVDREIVTGTHKETVEEVDPETGEKKTVEKVVSDTDEEPIVASAYAKWFQQYTTDCDDVVTPNPFWEPNNEYNLMFLRSRENYINDKLRSKKRVFLNDIYATLGLPETKEGQIMGYKYPDTERISFGIYKDAVAYNDYLKGRTEAILLEFTQPINLYETM